MRGQFGSSGFHASLTIVVKGKIMEHALVTIEQTATVQPAVVVGLNGGHVNYGVDLVTMYAVDDIAETKVQKLAEMAKVITTAEFSDAIKAAKSIADAMDKANGFVKAEGSKGQAMYGAKRQLLNSRLSEAKRIFGVFKQAPDVLKEKGYWLAVQTARGWLDSHGKTWDGNTAETGDIKAARKVREGNIVARSAVQTDNPQNEGETIAQWQERLEPLVQAKIEKMKDDTFNKRVETLVASLLKQFGNEREVLEAACVQILSHTEEPASE